MTRTVSPPPAFLPFRRAESEQSVPARFADQVRRSPDRMALQTQSLRLTFRELDLTANRLAHEIIAHAGEKNCPVAVLVDDDALLVVSLLAALKAGKIFVPLDASHPPPRLRGILEHTGAALVLTDRTTRATARSIIGAMRTLEVADARFGVERAGPPPEVRPDALATILYTSGSTGEPKGVVQNHRNWLHHILRHTNGLKISSTDRMCLLAARASAQAMVGILGPLLNGAILLPFRIQEQGFTRLARWLVEERITLWQSSTSVFRHFAAGLPIDAAFPDMRLVRIGSEPGTRRDAELFRERFPRSCTLVNALSSTETGTVAHYVVDGDIPVSHSVLPVGVPAEDVSVSLLDENAVAVGAGEVGEIAVGSRYLALGYWRQPELTARVFIQKPDGTRCYRTGDLGRIGPEGYLEHLGRKDSRVKIRGNRVELTEIEAVLLEAPAVRSAVVAPCETAPGQTRLAAYVVPAAPVPTVAALRRFLGERLPSYMVPSVFTFLAELPTGPGGKVDRRALPAPQTTGSVTAGQRPRNHLETQLCSLWEELLGAGPVGVNDDFLDLGGDSLLVTRLLHSIELSFGERLSIAGLLGGGITVARLAEEILRRGRREFSRPLVTLHRGRSRLPFFFLHGDFDTGGFFCQKLARSLGASQTFHAVVPHGLDGGPVPGTVEAMAADRLRAILAVQPAGPYLIGGYCNGGIVAFEIARQLHARGQEVAALLLVDARLVNAPVLGVGRLLQGAERLLRLTPPTRQRWYDRYKYYREDLLRARQRGLAGWRELLGRKWRLLTGQRGSHSDMVSDAATGRSLWEQYHRALHDYVPGDYAGRVVLFRSSYLDEKAPASRDAGWKRVAAAVEVHPLPGDHRECVTTFAGDLADLMHPYLQAAQRCAAPARRPSAARPLRSPV